LSTNLCALWRLEIRGLILGNDQVAYDLCHVEQRPKSIAREVEPVEMPAAA